jgi:hypothetical protein
MWEGARAKNCTQDNSIIIVAGHVKEYKLRSKSRRSKKQQEYKQEYKQESKQKE